MRVIRDVILAEEAWLVKRVIHYAKLTGYTQYTAAQVVYWEQAIHGLSQSMTALIEQDQPLSEFAPAMDFSLDPVISFGIEEAERHRTRGVSLVMFFGLMKYFRRAYTDLLEAQNYPTVDLTRYRSFVIRFFDHVEMGLIDCWANLNARELLSELQAKNRQLVQTKAQYDSVKASMPVAMLVASPEGRILDFNQAASWLFPSEPAGGLEDVHPARTDVCPWLEPVLAEYRTHGEQAFNCNLTLVTPAGPRVFTAHCGRVEDLSERYNGIIIVLVEAGSS
jgi:hypothetical protein